ncbi:hypothetical protein KC19_2G029100 [Ceratodon purpureus]|uniref:Secreted protein n=1 Tax=Ceratodon purpureus TaxID=3225 RepID=A0A8T0IRI9_CERPU|nr:hypothetical protein KC19_2G029100 [Ceratodon purpureus]
MNILALVVVVVDLVWWFLVWCEVREGEEGGEVAAGRFRCVVLRGFLIGLDVERAIGGSAAGCGSCVCFYGWSECLVDTENCIIGRGGVVESCVS